MMSRKHYQALADDLKRWAQPDMTGIAYRQLVAQISLTMKEDNSRHDQERFAEACGIVGAYPDGKYGNA